MALEPLFPVPLHRWHVGLDSEDCFPGNAIWVEGLVSASNTSESQGLPVFLAQLWPREALFSPVWSLDIRSQKLERCLKLDHLSFIFRHDLPSPISKQEKHTHIFPTSCAKPERAIKMCSFYPVYNTVTSHTFNGLALTTLFIFLTDVCIAMLCTLMWPH